LIIRSQIFIGSNGIKSYQVKRTAEKPNCRDTVVLMDRKGTVIEIEAQVVWNSLLSFSAALNLTPEAFVGSMRKIIEEDKDGL
jgi:hypothetical protein